MRTAARRCCGRGSLRNHDDGIRHRGTDRAIDSRATLQVVARGMAWSWIATHRVGVGRHGTLHNLHPFYHRQCGDGFWDGIRRSRLQCGCITRRQAGRTRRRIRHHRGLFICRLDCWTFNGAGALSIDPGVAVPLDCRLCPRCGDTDSGAAVETQASAAPLSSLTDPERLAANTVRCW